ncbi:uroporphyrinogen-III synthase [Elstera sp.]|jgi:uroporphyrinogen-III synthase|uniref:uroporphyrinogen-III synthase n=1 Tax=Elstera sp. TaxID=1916664 RepID=UPI0037BFC3BD
MPTRQKSPLGLLITRPAEDAAATAEKLQRRGFRPIITPLLAIAPIPDAVLPDLGDYLGLIVTSANGVRALAQSTDRRSDLIMAVGEHTAARARALGFTRVESADGDALVLVNYVSDRLDPDEGKLLHLRGETLAVDPAPMLRDAGFTVDSCTLYRAETVDRLTDEAEAALAAGTVEGVLLYSPRSATAFEAALHRGIGGEVAKALTAYCLSPAVAKALALAYRSVQVAPHPLGEALLGLLPAVSAVPSAPREETMSEPVLPPADAPKAETRQDRARADAPAALPPPAAPPKAAKSGSSGGMIAGLLGGVIAVVALGGIGFATREQWVAAMVPPAPAPDRSLVLRVDALERTLAALPRPADEAALRADLDKLTERLAAVENRPVAVPVPASDPEAIAALRRRVEGFEQALRGTADATSLAALSERSARLSEQMADYLQRVTQARSATEETTRALVKQAALAVAALRVNSAVAQGVPFADAIRLLASLGAQDAELMGSVAGLDALAATGVPTGEALRARFPDLVSAVKAAELASGESGWRQEIARFTGHLIVIRRTDVPVGDGLDARLAKLDAHLSRNEWDAALLTFEGAAADLRAAAEPFLAAIKERRDAERFAARLLDHTIGQLAKVGP